MENAQSEFYRTYKTFKNYVTPELLPWHRRQFDRQFWNVTRCQPDMSVLEVGCGTGVFLLYLRERGVTDFVGIDQDPDIEAHIPDEVAGHFMSVDIGHFLTQRAGKNTGGPQFDRIALFDVLEHFSPTQGLALLKGLKCLLRPGGKIVVRLPNMSSPWGLAYQYGDLTHQGAYGPGALSQLAMAAGLTCDGIYPVAPLNPLRRALDGCIHWGLSRLLATPPEIWTANMLGVFSLREEKDVS